MGALIFNWLKMEFIFIKSRGGELIAQRKNIKKRIVLHDVQLMRQTPLE